MLSEAQINAKKEKVYKTVTAFLSGEYTIDQVAAMTGYSSSAVQRYLNDEEYISLCFKNDAEFVMNEIAIKLEKNKKDGLSNGGLIYSMNNIPLKDDLGHFKGSLKK